MQLIGWTLYSVLYSVSDTWDGLVTTYRLTYRPTVLHPAVLQTRLNQPVLSSSSLSEYFVLTLNKSVIIFDWLDWRCWIRAAVWVIFYQVTAWRPGQPLIILQLLSRRKSCGVTRPDWDCEVYYSNGRCQTRNDQTLLLRTDSPWSDGSLASPQDCYIITATARYLPSQQAPHSFK